MDSLVGGYIIQNRPLMATMFYFPAARMDGDIDNIVKPILDGMIGAAYIDDGFVERIVVQKFEPGVNWAFFAPSPVLAGAIEARRPTLYIRLDKHLAWRSVG